MGGREGGRAAISRASQARRVVLPTPRGPWRRRRKGEGMEGGREEGREGRRERRRRRTDAWWVVGSRTPQGGGEG